MFPVRRIFHSFTVAATIVGIAAATAAVITPAASAATSHGCKAGAIHTSAKANTVCDRHHHRYAVVPFADAPQPGTGSRAEVQPARCPLDEGTVRRGTTLVTIVKVTSATTGKTLERRSSASICGDDGAWHAVADPMAVFTLIPTSTVIERSENR